MHQSEIKYNFEKIILNLNIKFQILKLDKYLCQIIIYKIINLTTKVRLLRNLRIQKRRNFNFSIFRPNINCFFNFLVLKFKIRISK